MKIFVCHAWESNDDKNKNETLNFVRFLNEHHPDTHVIVDYLDMDNIYREDYKDWLIRQMTTCDKFILLITPTAYKSIKNYRDPMFKHTVFDAGFVLRLDIDLFLDHNNGLAVILEHMNGQIKHVPTGVKYYKFPSEKNHIVDWILDRDDYDTSRYFDTLVEKERKNTYFRLD